MNQQLVEAIITPLRRYPSLGVSVGTGALSMLTYWWYAVSIRNTLLSTQQRCQQTTDEAFAQCRQMLKAGESSWGADIHSRDAQVRRLELQNVKQTRSVARLESAMKMCLLPSEKSA